MSQEGKEIWLGDVKVAKEEIDRREAGYEKIEDGYKCKKCGSTIMQTTLYVSIWLTPLRGGTGRVETYPFPYCPKCDGKPKIVRAHT